LPQPSISPQPRANAGGKYWTTREAYLLAMVCLAIGVIAGYLLHNPGMPNQRTPVAPTTGSNPGTSEPAPAAPSAASLGPVLQPMLDALKVDPRNFDTLVGVGNTYYDHQLYSEAVKYYERALEVRPNEINVRTDLGTSYYYLGQPQKAIAEFQKSLVLNPTHANTLFNLGVVKKDGLHDNAGAIAAWEKLLKTNPDYPNRQRVLDLIEQAKKS
jgi:cytochrome c-type biogenesis protein CcmH/NrfG